MKAVRVHQYGGPEVMVLENVEIPTPSDTQVLVEVKAAGINPVETYIRAGVFHRVAPLPYTPGGDGAGIVKQVGSKVTTVKPGDKVYFLSAVSGSYAQFCTVNETSMLPLGQLSFVQGAAIGIPYYTAARSIYHCAKNNTQKGNTILIHGASGAVGLACVQIAKALGMVVYGTAGSVDGLKLVKDNGAKEVYNHREKGYKEALVLMYSKMLGLIMPMRDWVKAHIVRQTLSQVQTFDDRNVLLRSSYATTGDTKTIGDDGFDVILEMLADKNLSTDLDLIAQNGIIVVIGCRGNAEINPIICIRKECIVTGVMLQAASPENWKEMHAAIQNGIQSGWIQPHVSRTYTLEEAPQSHEDIINTTAAQGKIVFKL